MGLIQLGYFDLGPVVITQPDEQKLILLLSNPRDEATQPGFSVLTNLFPAIPQPNES